MNKYFYLLPMLSLPLQALTVETRATHGVFYAGVAKEVFSFPHKNCRRAAATFTWDKW